MGANEEGYTVARVHQAVERGIESSGTAWTFLRPNSFMQNVVMSWAVRSGAESIFYSINGVARISHVDVRDIAAVAVQVLNGSAHVGRVWKTRA